MSSDRRVYYVQYMGDFLVQPTFDREQAEREAEKAGEGWTGIRTKFRVVSEPETVFRSFRPTAPIRGE